MTTIKNAPTAERGATILAGLNAYRHRPEPGSVSEAEHAQMAEGVAAIMHGRDALRDLLTVADTFGYPTQFSWETREEFVARRTAELDEVAGRVKAARAAMEATNG